MQKQLIISLIAFSAFNSSCRKGSDHPANPIPRYNTLNGQAPLVIGHRGVPGLRPEHTLQSYTLAIELGADFVEPDLVVTKDGYLICRHEPMLSGTTNVAAVPEFAGKKTIRSVDGVEYDDWFACDFTLEEIKKLRAVQAFSERSQEFNSLFEIPTFEELITLVKTLSAAKGRPIGIYPETKHPTFHEKLNLAITDKLLTALEKAGWNHKNAPVYVQSFEVSNLQFIHQHSSVKIVQLFDAYDVDKEGKLLMTAPNGQPFDFVASGDPRTYNDLASETGLEFIKTYADGIGPWKPFIQPYTCIDLNNDQQADDINNDGIVNDADFKKLPATDLINRAHKKGLFVHAYTFRDEGKRLLSDYNGDPKAEYKTFYNLGIDGVFSDFAGTAVEARQ